MTTSSFARPYSLTAVRVTTRPLLLVLVVTLLGALLISLPNLLDPMIRHDDYPAFLAQPTGYWEKTLHEGRWLNYFWHFRGVVTPAWLNFALYQGLWAVVAACLAVAAMGQHIGRSLWVTSLLALLILMAPPATMISLWFNTLLPGLAFVALYCYLACRLSPFWHRALLLPFTVVTFMSYTTYPLILLAACILRSEHRSLRDLGGLAALFLFSFGSAMLVTYAINWQVYGIFGVPLADWRHATPADDLGGFVANLPKLKLTLYWLWVANGYDSAVALMLVPISLLIASLILLRKAPMEALYLHAGLWCGIALMAAQVLQLGVRVPARSFAFVWIFYAAIIARAAVLQVQDLDLKARIGRWMPLIMVLVYLPLSFQHYLAFRPWLAETRDLAERVLATSAPIIVYGDVMQLTTGKLAKLQDPMALPLRMEALTGRDLVLCGLNPEVCHFLQGAGRRFGLPKPFVASITGKGDEFLLVYSGA
jgi:hypothetical protein